METDDQTGQIKASLPLSVYWLQIATVTRVQRSPPINLRVLSGLEEAREVGVAGRPVARPERNLEIAEAMVAISAATNVMDALFGALQHFDQWRPAGGRNRNATRAGEIIEQLKHSFEVGKCATTWSRELDWLFHLRHSIVHHSERMRPMEIAAADTHYIVLSATEAFSLTACDSIESAKSLNGRTPPADGRLQILYSRRMAADRLTERSSAMIFIAS
jgi:hypothetical protein